MIVKILGIYKFKRKDIPASNRIRIILMKNLKMGFLNE